MKPIRQIIEQHEKINNRKSIAHGDVVDTSPSDKLIKSGGYKKSHPTIDGMRIAIENPLGTTRSGTDPDGKKWSVTMKSDYGYIKNSVGYDKDHVDVFIKPGYKGGNEHIHVVNQHGKDGKFDEHKCIMGATDEKNAMATYNMNYEKGWTGGKNVVTMPLDHFRKWVVSKEPKKGPAKYSEKETNEMMSFTEFLRQL